jgi:hypothetical protein
MIARTSFGTAVVCVAVAMGLLPVAAQANPESPRGAPITSYSAVPGNAQAGGHPDLEVNFSVENRLVQGTQSACNCEDVKNATVHLPAGLVGNPSATPQCSIADFSADNCPIDSQIGVAYVVVGSGGSGEGFVSAIYNVVPPPNVAGLLAFKIYLFNTPQFTVLSARTGSDYGLDSTTTSIYHGLGFPVKELTEDLWGVPADPIHDPLRLNRAFNPQGQLTAYNDHLCNSDGSPSTADPNTIRKPCDTKIPPAASNSPLTPFLQNPTSCVAPLSSSLDTLAYDGVPDHAEDSWPQMTGCDELSFNPSLYAQPTTTETDTASGIDINLTVPQQLSPTIPSPSELRAATVTLPPGFSINPNAADGKTACADTEALFGTEEEAQCPEFAKVGTLTIESSALPGPVPGFVYLGQPLPGNRYRIFLVANGFATHIKLAGIVSADSSTGQLVITFKELPQSPLTAFDMHFFGSERGLLATPTECGKYPVTTTFTPWDETIGTQTSTQFFTLDSGPNGTPCPGPKRPFNPGLQAASAGNTAAADSPFAVEVTRNDGDQNLSALSITTPPGFSATVAGIPYCSDASIVGASSPAYSGLEEEANPSCPAASQIGTALTGAGAGNHPVYVSGKVYLAGPYKGAPLSLAVITPAISGPYDLGNVVVRAALHVNPETAQITAVSDPLPQILEGIPLRLRSIRINLNRKNFTLNPTNCDPFSVSAQVTGDQGAEANLTSPFQVANCGHLPFAPKLTLGVAGSTKRAGNPALHATLTAKGGEANIASTAVTLPSSELLDNAHIKNPCTKVQFAAGATPGEKCPASSILGFARASTPLLERPLEGPVYLRSPLPGHKLPDLVAALNGQIDITLIGRIESGPGGGLRTRFETVPDAPITRFTLNLDGGHKGLLVNSVNLCKLPQKVLALINGQNGATENQNQTLGTPCAKAAKRKSLRRARVVG